MPKQFHILAAVVAATCLAAATGAAALTIDLPTETTVYKPNSLAGYELVQRNCMTCHSAQYVASQPTTSSRTYWDATVKKMKKPFGATFDDAEIPAMVDYLTKTYGMEPVPPAAKPAATPPVTTQK